MYYQNAFSKATKLYQDVCKEKDTMLGKLAVLERNKRTLIEDNDMLNKKHKEALKVCMVTAVKGKSLTKFLFFFCRRVKKLKPSQSC